MGFLASLDKGWSFMRAAFAMAKQNRRLLAPSVYMVLVTLLYFAGWFAALVTLNPHWSKATWGLVGGVATFGSFLIFYFFCGMTVNMIDVHLKGGRPSLADGARDAAKNFLAITFLALISTIVEMFAKAARNENSVAAKIIAGIIQTIWTLAAFLLLPAIIIEDASFGSALRRVRDLHKGNLLLVGVGEIGVRLVTLLIGLVWFAVIFGVAYASFHLFGRTTALAITLMLGGSMFAVFAAFNVYLRMAYYTCLYAWAVSVEQLGPQATAPGPLGVVLGHLAPIADASALPAMR